MGTGEEISMLELSRLISRIVGYEGEIVTDPSKPDGMMRRVLNSERLTEMGWKPAVSLQEGLSRLYAWYLSNTQGKAE